MGNLNKIEHIIVLMQENRSFDCMLGKLYPKSKKFNGLSGSETNPLQGQPDVSVWSSEGTDPKSMCLPNPDPGESWDDINMELFGLNGIPGTQIPSMNGFVNNYMQQSTRAADKYQPNMPMHYYTPEQLPALSYLAKQYAVSDQWFASAPCQTIPNRFFMHAATANGYENNSPYHFLYTMNTIFNALTEVNQSWHIYFSDFPQSIMLSKLWPYTNNFSHFDNFKNDAKNGNLPAYTFIEPQYWPFKTLPNDQHPPLHVGLGDQLVADVYNAVRSSPLWEKTLLIITRDEHGGCYDHVPPPLAVPPSDTVTTPFNFDRYGVRVPTVLISPYIKQGTILRVVDDETVPHNGPPYPFDHTSIIATIRKRFKIKPLTNRDAVAPDLEKVLNLSTPENNGPLAKPSKFIYTKDDLEAALDAPLNDFQKAMHATAAHLPTTDQAKSSEQHTRSIQIPDHKTPREAVPYIKDQLEKFLGQH